MSNGYTRLGLDKPGKSARYKLKDPETGDIIKVRTNRHGEPVVIKRKGKGFKQKIKSKKGYTKFKTSKKGHKTVVGQHFIKDGRHHIGTDRRSKPSKKGKTRKPLNLDDTRWYPGKSLQYRVGDAQIEFEGEKKAKGGMIEYKGGGVIRDAFTEQYD
jgi:hypothetical protein